MKQSSNIPYYLLLIVTFGIVYIYTFDSKLAMLGDNAYYYALGKAVAQGEGYVNISKVSHSPNNHYPPGYPVILSFFMLFTDSIFVFKLLNGLFFLGSVLLGFRLFEQLTGNRLLSLTICLMVVLNAHLLLYSSIMMSEVPFLFFSLLSIFFFLRADLEKPSFKDPNLIGAFVFMVVTYYIRSLGIALLAGYALHFLLAKKWKAMAVYILSLVAAALPWFIRGNSLGGSSYINQLTMINPYQPALGRADFGDFVDRFFANFGRYITYEIPSAIFPSKQPDYGSSGGGGEWLIGLILTFLFFYGLVQLTKFRWVLLGYALGSFGVLMIWPEVWVGVRFIVPMIPILVLGVFNGLFVLLEKLMTLTSSRKPRALYLLIFLLFLIKPIGALHDQAKAPYSNGWKNYFDVAKWVKRNTEPGTVVSCGKPALFYMHSGSYTMRYKFAQDPKTLLQDLEKKGVDYVVIDQIYGNTFRYLLPAVRNSPERFEQVLHLKNPDTFLLKLKK